MEKAHRKYTVLGINGVLGVSALTVGITGITAWLENPISAQGVEIVEKEQEAEAFEFFLPIPRELRRAMEDTEKLMEMERYAEAVRQLDAILGAEEDYFFKKFVDDKDSDGAENNEDNGEVEKKSENREEKAEPYRNVKLVAEELLERMPTRGKEMYEIEFGTVAKVMLEDALAEGKMEQLAQVARRYFFTQAGSEATFLQGIYFLDRRQPATARELFAKLRRYPCVGRRFEPILTLYYAASCWAAGRFEEGENALTEAEKKGGVEWNALEIGGVSIQEALEEARAENVGNVGKSGTLATWLQKKIPSWVENGGIKLSDGWQLALQNQARSSDNGAVSMPVLTPCWSVSMLDDPEGVTLAELLRTRNEEKTWDYLLPSHSPLVVGDTALMRTAWNLTALDMRTGKRLWSAPGPGYAEIREQLSRLEEADLGSLQGMEPGKRVKQLMASLIRHQLWGEKIYASLSSDGERVFCVEDTLRRYVPEKNGLFAQTFGTALPNGAGKMAQNPMQPLRQKEENLENTDSGAVPNRLACYNIRTGKLLWQLEEDTPTAQGLMFLGSPLCVGERLYIIGERNGLVQLFALEKTTGKILWTQTLSLALPQEMREAIACTPQICEGVLVCPTPNGTLVGVDAATHSLRWGNVFMKPNDVDARYRYFEPTLVARIQEDIDSSAGNREIIVRGERVFFISYRNQRLVCLNGATGEILWETALPAVYSNIVSVNNGNVYLSEPTRFAVYNARNGALNREYKLTEAGKSCLGFVARNEYFQAVNGKEIARFSLNERDNEEKGIDRNAKPLEIARRRDSGELGNLVPAGDFVLSQNGVTLEAFVQKDAAPRYIKALREKDAESPEALMIEATMLWDEGKLADAIALLEKGRPYTDELLKQAGLEFLKQLASRENDTEEVETTLGKFLGWMETDAEKARFCQLAVQEMIKTKRWEEALDWSRKLWEIAKVSEKEILVETDFVSPEKRTELEKEKATEGDVSQDWKVNIDGTVLQTPTVWIGRTLQRLMENAPAESTVRAKITQWAETEHLALLEEMKRFRDVEKEKQEIAEKLRKKYVAFRIQFAFWDGIPKVEKEYLELVKFTRNFAALEAYWFQKEPSCAKVAATLTKTYQELGDLKRAALYVRWLEREFPEETLLDGKTATEWRLGLPENHVIRNILDPEMAEFPQGKITVTKKDDNREAEESFSDGLVYRLGAMKENCTPFVDTQLITEFGVTAKVMCKDTLGRALFYFPGNELGHRGGKIFRGIRNEAELIHPKMIFGSTVGYLSMNETYSFMPEITWDTYKMGDVPKSAWRYQARKMTMETHLQPYLRPIEEDILAESLDVLEGTAFRFGNICTYVPNCFATQYTDNTTHAVNVESGELLWKCKRGNLQSIPIWSDGKLHGISLEEGISLGRASLYSTYSSDDFGDSEVSENLEEKNEDSEAILYDKTIEEIWEIYQRERGRKEEKRDETHFRVGWLALHHPTTGQYVERISYPKLETVCMHDGLVIQKLGDWIGGYDLSQEKFVWLRKKSAFHYNISIDNEWLYYLNAERELEMIQLRTGKLLKIHFPEPKLAESEMENWKWNPKETSLIAILPDEDGCFTAIWGHSEDYEPEEAQDRDDAGFYGNDRSAPNGYNSEEAIPLNHALICRFDADGKPLWEKSRFQEELTYLLGNLPTHIPALGMAYEEEKENSENRSTENALVLKFLDRRNGRVIYNARLPMNAILRMVGNPLEKQAELVLMKNSRIVFDFSDEPYGEEKEIVGIDRRAALMAEIKQRNYELSDKKRYAKNLEARIKAEREKFAKKESPTEDEKRFGELRIEQLEKERKSYQEFIAEEEGKITVLEKELEAQNELHGGPLELPKEANTENNRNQSSMKMKIKVN